MQQRKTLHRVLSVAALAMLFGAGSAYAQTESRKDAAGMTQESSAGQMSATGQTETTGASTATGTSGASDSSGSSGSSGASGASGASDSSGSSDASSSGAAGSSAQSSSGASDSASGAAQSGGTLSKADQSIMREMARANLAEIEAANIALKQSSSDEVKSFAQKMIDDHTQAQQELEQLAQAKGVTLPTTPDKKHQAMAKKMEKLEGAKFDKQYMSQGGVKDHRETHRMLSRAQGRATDPDLKAYLTKVTPIVGGHMKMAQETQSGTGTASGSSMGPAGTSSSGASDSSGSSGSSSPSDTSGSSSDTSGSSGSTESGK